MYRLSLIFAFLLFSPTVRSQSIDTPFLTQQFSLINKAYPTTSLFLHIDKSVYTNNEKIWFAAYLIDIPQNQPIHKLLSIFLAAENNRKIELEGKFQIETGVCSGSLRLPDTIPPGKYQLIAYTDVLDNSGSPLVQFSIPIEIKNIAQHRFSSQLLLDSADRNGVFRLKVSVKTDTADAAIKSFPIINYSLGNDKMNSGILKSADTIVEVPSAQITPEKSIFSARVSYNNQVQQLSIALPLKESKRLDIKFFPEGGDLSAELPCRVAWEAKTSLGDPVALTALLLKGAEVIDTLETNSYGIGTFQLSPDAQSIYSLKICAGSYSSRDTTFVLPKTTMNQAKLHLPQAVVSDTLDLHIYSLKDSPVQILIHNYKKDYAFFKTGKLSRSNHIKLPLAGLPKGLSTITVLDQAGHLLAERLFFAHYDKNIYTTITTDKNSYGQDDTIRVKIKTNDRLGRPVQGIFSAAVVQDNRIRGNFADIETSIYLSHNLGSLPTDPLGLGFRHSDYLENILLVKGWRKHTWQEFINTKPQDTLQGHQISALKGNVRRRNKILTKPVQIFILNGETAAIIESDDHGSFTLSADQLRAREGNKIKLLISGALEREYKFDIDDPYHQVNSKMAEQFERDYANGLKDNLSTLIQEPKGLTRTINLQTVNIKAGKRNGLISGYHGEPGVNACGDYVDEYDYLNYEKSVNRFKPIPGKTYLKRTDLEENYFKVEGVYYHGCTEDDKIAGYVMYGISDGMEYSDNEEERINNPYRSTVYWQSGILTDTAGQANFKFTAGSLAGKFRIIIQGMTTDNLISGNGVLTVK